MTKSEAAGRPAAQVGATFPATHADSMPDWRVVSYRGGNAWDCEIAEPHADAGTRRVFGTEEIERAMAQARAWSTQSDANEAFWASRRPGETLHYHNGFGQYVRGTVVAEGGEHQLRPTALVGAWGEADLPRIDRHGRMSGGFQATRIADGRTFRPNASNIWESGSCGRAEDPRAMEAIDLTPRTEAEPELARLEDARVRAAALIGARSQTAAQTREALVRARHVIDEALQG